MNRREPLRLDRRVWTVAVIGMVIGGVVGLLIWGPLQMVPFAMIGFALGLAVAWALPRANGSRGGAGGSGDGQPGPEDSRAQPDDDPRNPR
ncbi:hypothetical protein JCM18882A_02470 [Brevibacterium metallidurans]|uniref:Uncharacterized protein n=3 Tax=Brevibacteriaceae TaxID=85019 RepID=A0ABP9U0M0_9MICO